MLVFFSSVLVLEMMNKPLDPHMTQAQNQSAQTLTIWLILSPWKRPVNFWVKHPWRSQLYMKQIVVHQQVALKAVVPCSVRSYHMSCLNQIRKTAWWEKPALRLRSSREGNWAADTTEKAGGRDRWSRKREVLVFVLHCTVCLLCCSVHSLEGLSTVCGHIKCIHVFNLWCAFVHDYSFRWFAPWVTCTLTTIVEEFGILEM